MTSTDHSLASNQGNWPPRPQNATVIGRFERNFEDVRLDYVRFGGNSPLDNFAPRVDDEVLADFVTGPGGYDGGEPMAPSNSVKAVQAVNTAGFAPANLNITKKRKANEDLEKEPKKSGGQEGAVNNTEGGCHGQEEGPPTESAPATDSEGKAAGEGPKGRDGQVEDDGGKDEGDFEAMDYTEG